MVNILIIIINYNGKENTLNCLASMHELLSTVQGAKVILIDNHSQDDSLAVIQNKYPRTVLIKNQANYGFAKGNNQGIRWGLKRNYDYFLLLNNDTIVNQSLIIELMKAMEKNTNAGLVSPKIYFAPGYEFHRDRYSQKECGKVIWFAGGHIDWQNMLCSHRGVDEVDSGQYDKITETDFATGCCMLIKKEVFHKVGLLDPRYFLYWEDVDFSVRSKKAGYKIFFAPQAVMWHKNAGSSRSGSDLHDYYLTRNRLLFGMKYAPLRTKAALIKESWYLIRKGRVGQKAGCRDFLRGHFGER